jgi:hypothetical protein
MQNYKSRGGIQNMVCFEIEFGNGYSDVIWILTGYMTRALPISFVGGSELIF